MKRILSIPCYLLAILFAGAGLQGFAQGASESYGHYVGMRAAVGLTFGALMGGCWWAGRALWGSQRRSS